MMPLLVGGFAIVLTFVGLRLVNQFAGLSIFAVNLVTGVGLGLGIDYSLFILSRYREELAGGKEPREAIQRTLQTAGRTVLYGSLTVAGALASMLVFPERFLYSMGFGGMIVALMAGTVSLLVLPAVLSPSARASTRSRRSGCSVAPPAPPPPARRAAGRGGRVPSCAARDRGAAEHRACCSRLPRPRCAWRLTPADARVLPATSETRQVADVLSQGLRRGRLADDHHRAAGRADLGADGAAAGEADRPRAGASSFTPSVRAPATTGAGGQLGRRAGARRPGAADRRAQAQVAPPRYLGRGEWELDLLPQGSGRLAANQALVKRLRALVNPRGGLVGGPTAGFIDQKSSIAAHVPLVLAILALVTCGFLFLMTGSRADAADGAGDEPAHGGRRAGLLVLIFQDGHGLLAARLQPDRRAWRRPTSSCCS